MVNSLLTAIVRADGDALVMHVGERPYVVASSGPVELSSRPLTLEAVTGMLGQLLPSDSRRALEELGAIEHELPRKVAPDADRFTVVAARGGDDIWIEVRRHRPPVAAAVPVAPVSPAGLDIRPPSPMAAAPPASPVAFDEPAPRPAVEPVVIQARPSAPRLKPSGVPAVAVLERMEVVRAEATQVAAATASAVAVPILAAPAIEEMSSAPPAVSIEALPTPDVPPVTATIVEPEQPIALPVFECREMQTAGPPDPAATETDDPAVSASAAPADELMPAIAVTEPRVEPAVSDAIVPDARPEPPLPEPAVTPAQPDAPPEPAAEEPDFAHPAPGPVGSPMQPPVVSSDSAPLVHPLVASPIVERGALGQHLYTPSQPAMAAGASAEAGTGGETTPRVVLPLNRHSVRMEPSARALTPSRIAGIDRLLRLAIARGANTLYLMAESRPSVRVDGDIALLEGEPLLSASEVESLLLDLAPERMREALEAGEGTEWMAEVPDVGRFRCQSFRDHRGPGGIFRMISARPASAEQLGLAREVQALCAEPEGLILVAGPRASGKSTLVSALVDLVNRTRNDYVITIESRISFVHEGKGCLISQREVRGGAEELATMVRAALRENPDVLVIEDLRSPEVVRLALDAMEAGHLVIASVSARGAATAVGRLLDQVPESRRVQAQLALAEGLRGVMSQVLLSKTAGGRIGARELLLNTPAVANLIAEGRISQLPLAIDNGRKHGMVPLNDALAAFVQSGVVDVKEAYRKAFERQAFLAVLRREGVDTSFVERLA